MQFHDLPLEELLFRAFGKAVPVKTVSTVGGGSINHTFKVESEAGQFFIKYNEFDDSSLFEKEEKGLDILGHANCINVPEVIHRDQIGQKNFLILSYIEKGVPSDHFWESFGKQLAQLHRQTQTKFGLDHDNHIGRLPQKNDQRSDWVDFFIHNRLEVQLGLALYNQAIDNRFAEEFRRLYAVIPGLLPVEPPALIHGDLWSGNFMVEESGAPSIFDPAVYYGHREMELAFTRLFGGFDLKFYQSYHNAFPLEPGFEDRMDIYNLYPLLVHVNLFGTSYLSGIRNTMRRFL